jgi:uncharacterized coiled-coil protein SlyX
MSDDLVKMARLAQRDERMSTGALYGALADRIEELESKLELSEGALDVASRSWRECQRILEQTEDKLDKAIDALEKVQAFVRDLEPHADQGHTLVPALREACETLAELKQGAKGRDE